MALLVDSAEPWVHVGKCERSPASCVQPVFKIQRARDLTAGDVLRLGNTLKVNEAEPALADRLSPHAAYSHMVLCFVFLTISFVSGYLYCSGRSPLAGVLWPLFAWLFGVNVSHDCSHRAFSIRPRVNALGVLVIEKGFHLVAFLGSWSTMSCTWSVFCSLGGSLDTWSSFAWGLGCA